MKRIFIGVKIDPGETLMNMITYFREGLNGERIKWTESGNFHITIAFLGDTEEDKVKAVGQMLSTVCTGSGDFEIIIRGAGVFKNLKDPRIVWASIEPSAELIRLFESVKLGLKDTGITIEERNFRPHLTLGRIKSINNNTAFASLIDRYQTTILHRQKVSEIILFESVLLNSGPVYKPLEKFALTDKRRGEVEKGRTG
jgi:RNA 2',3'-cyclic 3'-phosphodiesterase